MKKKTSTRITVAAQVAPITREEAEHLMGEIAALKAQEMATKAEMDQRLAQVRQEYETKLTNLAEQIAAKVPFVQTWAEANRTVFGENKSTELLHGRLGFRTATPSLKLLSKTKWDDVLEKLRSTPGMRRYIRTTEEVNKELLLADRETLGESKLTALGVKVSQKEDFFIDPKITETETRETVAA